MKIFLLKQLTCLFAFLFMGIIGVISTCNLNATITTSFPPSDFRAVDHTTSQYTQSNGHQYNPKGIIGYYYKPRNIENAYQLTDTIPHMTVAIWNKNKIDLNQNWEFDFKLFFDTGNASYNQGQPFGSPGRIVADGIAFVLQNDARPYAIGAEAPSLGYAGIRPSFAIEFDTEYNNWWWEGYGTDAYDPNRQTLEHINYLKNGTVSNEGHITPPPYYKPMQNNSATVCVGDWFNVKIVWRKVYANSKTYYDLLTYMEEKSDTNRPLLLRDSVRFNSLSEVMTGLAVDENCQALVTWGITSATCSWANHQMVQFVKLETTNVPPPPSPTVLIVGNCVVGGYIGFPDPIVVPSNSDPNNSINPYQPYYDTLLQGADITGCYEASVPVEANDTIEYTISCADVNMGLKCNYWLSLSDIPVDTEIEYYLNDTLVTDSSFYATSYSWGQLLYLSLKYPYEGANSVANAKVVISGVEYNFKIFVEDSNCSEICEAVTIVPAPAPPPNPNASQEDVKGRLYYTVEINPVLGSDITTVSVNVLPSSSSNLMQSSTVTRLTNTSYDVFLKFKTLTPFSKDSTTYRICATLENGITCCDTFLFVITSRPPDYGIYPFLSSTPGAVEYKILDTNALYSPLTPNLNVTIYDDYGNIYQTLYDSVPVGAEGIIYYGDLPVLLNNIVFQWGDKTKTVRVVKISK